MKVLEANCASSEEVKRKQIRFDEETGLISEIGELKVPREKVDFYFEDDCLLFAGMGDIHIHAREDTSGKNNYKEDFLTAFEAMKNGGVTHAGDMPNNPIPPIDNASYEAKFKLGSKAHRCLWFYAGIGPETRPLSYPVPYKVYMGPSIGDLFFKDLKTLDDTLSHYRGQHVSFHCEDPEILEAHKSAGLHHEKRPVEAETVATRDALMLIEKYELKGKLCHYSSDEGLKLIRAARKNGVNVSIEVTPQHLYFDLENLESDRLTSFQMNPPIRHQQDRDALREALLNGEIQFLATDHAPHTAEEKAKGTSGLTGLDTFGGFVTWLLAEGFSPQLIALVTAENPGTFHNQFMESWKKLSADYNSFGLGLGFLKPGFRANFTVLKLHSAQTVTSDKLKTKVKHSPFLGVTFPGRLESLFIGGKKV
ncbi:MAG: amidohydrolase family protein [Bdellovibrionales bacterium]|nr:amidohydrolase family protein [Bdellovibrionales bacterium]